MNLLEQPGFEAFTEDDNTIDFEVEGLITLEVPEYYQGTDPQTLGGGTITVQQNTDGPTFEGTRQYRSYVDGSSDEAFTVAAINKTYAATFAGWTRIRLSLGGSSSPSINCVELKGNYRPIPGVGS